MAADTREVRGLDDLKAKFAEIPLQLRKRYLRNWLAVGGRIVRGAARQGAPVLRPAAKAPYRKAGTVRDAIAVRTSKIARRSGDVGVFVNVKPLRPGGAKNPNDPYYWRWQEFGWNPGRRGESKRQRRVLNRRGSAKRVPGKGFLRAAVDKLPEALAAFELAAAKWFTKINATARVE